MPVTLKGVDGISGAFDTRAYMPTNAKQLTIINQPESPSSVKFDSHTSPDAADSSFVQPRTRAAHGIVPGRSAAVSPVSFTYDNGYGRVESQLLQEHHLPSNIKTTDQLVEFIRSRDRDNNHTSSSSRCSSESTFVSNIAPSDAWTYNAPGNSDDVLRPASQDSRIPPSPFISPRPGRLTSRVVSNLLTTGFSRRYVSAPDLRVLPGATRKHNYQGYWLKKGTMRTLESPKTKAGKLKESKTKSVGRERYVETSGWYDAA
ncbi:hypothetical protein PV08_10848 [Exophiala spinifera]|uniref:Uncharacterized protein n=1 Tax=Exophiala spinifera TaxID=91928 RepID=A0A0D1ZF19_9EURO|nr:uncharacterized protein PV08_10848 [Exophiala spinifera]KIW11547.1 hypothetical protein PV08_10848 [Exophiala spinifera]